MLLRFKVSNYKSFLNEIEFSMLPAPKQKGLEYSLFRERFRGRSLKVLSSSVVYGPNASGKTNMIGAMDVLRSIVLEGDIKNGEKVISPNNAAAFLELIPNSKLNKSKPVNFEIDFMEGDLRIQYNLSLDLGTFLISDYKRRILKEDLIVNGYEIFNRSQEINIKNTKELKRFTSIDDEKQIADLVSIATNSLDPQELFLTNGFRLLFSVQLAQFVMDWFANKFLVIYRADAVQILDRKKDYKKGVGIYLEKTLRKATGLFGVGENELGYTAVEDEQKPMLYSIFGKKDNLAIPAEVYESFGTLRFINIFPLVIRAIKSGGTLVVDEFDASIHPMALMSIINIFHNDDINVNKAQLVFNTHNPIFLNQNLFRRDEIKFVERDEDNGSVLYSLSDFGTSGRGGVRKNEDYMKNYFVSRYGAIKEIDFTPVFENLLKDENEVLHDEE
ncbi:MAG: ATP-binding protein [Lachnospiraceae bacterium]|nr:ATP-binding protein [Lachnospiraceae bacterium]